MAQFDEQMTKGVTISVAVLGLVLTLALEADVLESGLWYPVFYAGGPAIAATAAFAHERPDIGSLRLLGVGVWLLVTSVLALAVVVILSLGYPPEVTQSPVSAAILAGVLYLGFLFVPVGLAVAAARRRGLRTALLLMPSPVGQALIAAILIIPR